MAITITIASITNCYFVKWSFEIDFMIVRAKLVRKEYFTNVAWTVRVVGL